VVDYLNPVTNLILAAIAVTYLYRVAQQLMQRRKA